MPLSNHTTHTFLRNKMLDARILRRVFDEDDAMNPLKNLREWLHVHEAAAIISEETQTIFDPADLFWLALEKKLNLSIRLSNTTPVILYTDAKLNAEDWSETESSSITWVTGVWDIVPFDAGNTIIENHARAHCSTELQESSKHQQLWIEEPSSRQTAKVKFLSPYVASITTDRTLEPKKNPDFFLNEYEMPEGAMLVVRTAEVNMLIQKLLPDKQPSQKTANKDAQIIHSLASALVGDLGPQPNKNAEAVSQALAQAGVEMPCTSRTLADRFKRAMND